MLEKQASLLKTSLCTVSKEPTAIGITSPFSSVSLLPVYTEAEELKQELQGELIEYRDMKLLDFTNKLDREGRKCGPATEAGIYKFLETVVEEKKKIDNVIVFSDCQIGRGHSFTSWYGTESSERSAHFHELFKEFRKVNSNANFIVVNLRQSGGTSVFDMSQRILNVAGWSESIFDTIKSQCKGWEAIISEIEAIEI